MSSIEFPVGYPVVLLGAFLIILYNVVLMFKVGGVRRRVFSSKFFKENFPELSKNKGVALGGYPDTGSGKYAEKLSHEDWLAFNNAQRAHYNYLEGLAMIIFFSLTAGLVFPRVAFLLEIGYLVGRVLYTAGYTSSGANGRLVGVIVLDLALLAQLGLALTSLVQLSGGFSGIVDFVVGK